MSALICPKCNVDMAVKSENGVETDVCPKCGGIWVDAHKEKAALAMRPAVFTVDEIRSLRKVYQPAGTVEKVRYFKCPRCTQLMHRVNYMHHSGIIIDKCKEHGIFFDKGELEKAAEFIKCGGIEFEKLKLSEHGLSEARTKIDSIALKVDRLAYKLPWWARLLYFWGF